ncbi:hypothetical protein J4Q44_G00111110 [Coregonus suidteri]|uniref:Uncharacterized protein n=1 Tax=Coregonus suidteri TaxID=861788 RepID=A0AAN8LTB8_9TELE
MGGNSSSHVSYENEGDHVTFVKGIRLTDKVINRMREERQAQKMVHPRSQQNGPASTLLTEPVVPLSTPAPTVRTFWPPLWNQLQPQPLHLRSYQHLRLPLFSQ